MLKSRGSDGTWVKRDAPHTLDDRNYGRFAFLTGGSVRNYSDVPKVLPEPRGYPQDGSDVTKARIKSYAEEEGWGHSASYLTLRELLAVDYDQKFVDKRAPFLVKKEDFVPSEPITLREFLGDRWFDILNELTSMVLMAQPSSSDNVRIVFDFDN